MFLLRYSENNNMMKITLANPKITIIYIIAMRIQCEDARRPEYELFKAVQDCNLRFDLLS